MKGGTYGIADVGRFNPLTGDSPFQLPTSDIFSTPAGWATIWFGACVLVIVGFYFGFGGLKGDVLS